MNNVLLASYYMYMLYIVRLIHHLTFGGEPELKMLSALQARVHGLSERQMRRLAEFDLARRQRRWVVQMEGQQSRPDSALEGIPSVPTMEQLPYLSLP